MALAVKLLVSGHWESAEERLTEEWSLTWAPQSSLFLCVLDSECLEENSSGDPVTERRWSRDCAVSDHVAEQALIS